MSSPIDASVPEPARLRAFMTAYPRIAADLAILLGAVVLIAWRVDPIATARMPGGQMAANTAIMTVLAGLALWLSSRAPVARTARSSGPRALPGSTTPCSQNRCSRHAHA